MLRIEQFICNPFQENTYLIYNEQKECFVIDPGCYNTQEQADLLNYIQSNQLQVMAIVNTHCHIDHVFGVNYLVENLAVPFKIHPAELPVLLAAPEVGQRFGVHCPPITSTPEYITQADKLKLGNYTFEIRFTPGHSPGSISFYQAESKWLISGDVLFQGSIGRTDLPGGSFETLEQSIRNELYTLPDDTTVFSGHGPTTTIGQEKRTNPFVKAH